MQSCPRCHGDLFIEIDPETRQQETKCLACGRPADPPRIATPEELMDMLREDSDRRRRLPRHEGRIL